MASQSQNVPVGADARAQLGARDSVVLEALLPGEAVLDARTFVPSPKSRTAGTIAREAAVLLPAFIVVLGAPMVVAGPGFWLLPLGLLAWAGGTVALLTHRVRRRPHVAGDATHLTGAGFVAVTQGRLLVFSNATGMPTTLRVAFGLGAVRVEPLDLTARWQDVRITCADGSGRLVRIAGQPAQTQPFARRLLDATTGGSS